jgi:hypothetical protein
MFQQQKMVVKSILQERVVLGMAILGAVET